MNLMLARQYVANDIICELIAGFAIKLDGEENDVEREFLKGCLKTYKSLKRDVDAFNKTVVEFVIWAYARNNGEERIEMERLRIAHRLGKILGEQGIPNARMVAEYWVEKEKEKESTEFFDAQDQDTVNFIKSIVDVQEIDNPLGFANAFINGKQNIQMVYDCLLKYYSEIELKEHYSKNFELFSLKIEEVQTLAEYLTSIGIEQEALKAILIKAIILGIDECRERNELVFKHFGDDKGFLAFLAKDGGLYYPHYYSDIVGGINYIVEELGTEKARTLLEENELFLILYRRKYRLQYSSLFGEAMEIIEKYK